MADAHADVERYACKHCRRELFTSRELMDHARERHQITTRRKIKDAKTKQLNSANMFYEGCSSWFLEEVQPWMDEDALAEGRIRCPNDKCQTRLGSFEWAGSQCSCGTWVTPSIKITKSRVDLILKANVMPIISTIMAVPTYVEGEPSTPSTEQNADELPQQKIAPIQSSLLDVAFAEDADEQR